ncbi:hypothetical protein PENSPDRAFT_695360 [Peniophora sp. CONT]|nr:hypothetical protein PENSPDRAFT_695360 [Peniophora sp. CONT]
MTTRPSRTVWQAAEWHLAASRINDIVMQLGPQLVTNLDGSEMGIRPRAKFSYGMWHERAQISQLSGFMAIEGMQAAPQLGELFDRFCDPSDRGVQLIHDLAHANQPLLHNDQDEKIVMTGDLWRICCFFRLHLSLAVAAEPYEVADWYHNLDENLMRPNESVAAQFAAEVYLRLKKWENMSISSTPALVDELQALIARINGVRESNEVMIGQLEGEVSRMELTLVCLYLQEHPQVPIPLSLRADLRATCTDPRIADSVIVALREVRRGRTMEEASVP